MIQWWEMGLRLLLAALLGSVIGINRGRLEWAAGLRTHMLVCVGSALAIIVSAFFMSGAVLMIMRLCVDRGMSRGWSYGLGAAFALHPFVIYYGGNGMSEAVQG